jgi:hypothetical protein
MLTDGFVSAPNAWSKLETALRPLKNRPGWRVELVGITPDNVPAWNKALSPLLRNRFQLVGGSVANKLLNQNKDE